MKTDIKQLLTLEQAAVIINRTPRLIRYHIDNGNGPKAIEVGGRRLYPKDALLDWDKHRRKREKKS